MFYSKNGMEFPTEIWREIMGYFHSHWRCTSHYIAATELFNKNPQIGWQRVREVDDSFYLFVIVRSWIYSRSPSIHHIINRPDVVICRGCAKGNVFNDFVAIWSAYAKKESRRWFIAHLRYVY
jgi:hypothetical protein